MKIIIVHMKTYFKSIINILLISKHYHCKHAKQKCNKLFFLIVKNLCIGTTIVSMLKLTWTYVAKNSRAV